MGSADMIRSMGRAMSVCALVAAFLLTAAAAAAQDVEPKNDAAPEGIDPELLECVPPELRYERVPIPAEKNALRLWQQADEKAVRADRFFEQLGVPEDRYDDVISGDALFPSSEEGRPLRQWIEANTEALDLLRQGIARGQFQGPEVLGMAEMGSFAFLWRIEKLARANVTRAKMHAGDGEFDAAVEALAEVISLGEMLQAGGPSLREYLVGLALEERALATARWLASQRPAPESVALDLISAVAPAAKRDEALAQAFRWEFRGGFLWGLSLVPDAEREMREMRERLSREPPETREAVKAVIGEKPMFDEPATVELAGSYYIRFLKSALGSWKDADLTVEKDWEEEYKVFTDEWQQALQPLLQKVQEAETEGGSVGLQSLSEDEREQMAQALRRLDNPFGKLLVNMMFPAQSTVVELSFRMRAEREATRAFLALRAYDLRKGRLPESLDELVEEKILPAVPVDMFSGESLRYDAQRRLLWSVGPDGVDDGGESEPGQWVEGQPDLVLSIPE